MISLNLNNGFKMLYCDHEKNVNKNSLTKRKTKRLFIYFYLYHFFNDNSEKDAPQRKYFQKRAFSKLVGRGEVKTPRGHMISNILSNMDSKISPKTISNKQKKKETVVNDIF